MRGWLCGVAVVAVPLVGLFVAELVWEWATR